MTDTVQDTSQDQPQDGGQTFDEAYVKQLRQEAAGFRTQLREAQEQIKQLSPLAEKARQLEEAQKSEAQKLSEQLAALQAERDSVAKQAALAAKQTTLVKLAAKAGVAPDVLDLLNVDAFDVTDEAATVAKLQTLAPKSASGGSASNPARTADSNGQLTPEEWYKARTGKRPSIFGG